MWIYANRSHVLCVCVCFFLFLSCFWLFLLCLACACLFECGCRYFGDQIGDVFTEEDFQLYRFVHCSYILFFVPVTYNFNMCFLCLCLNASGRFVSVQAHIRSKYLLGVIPFSFQSDTVCPFSIIKKCPWANPGSYCWRVWSGSETDVPHQADFLLQNQQHNSENAAWWVLAPTCW